jgi:hypothetical protein
MRCKGSIDWRLLIGTGFFSYSFSNQAAWSTSSED